MNPIGFGLGGQRSMSIFALCPLNPVCTMQAAINAAAFALSFSNSRETTVFKAGPL